MENTTIYGNNYNIVVINLIANEYGTVQKTTEKDYNFKCSKPLFDQLAKGSLVVVTCSTGLQLGYVKELVINSFDNAEKVNKATAWVIDKVNLEEHNKRKEMETKRKWIVKQLNEMKAGMQDILIYEALAEKFPAAKLLVEELKTLE